MRPFFLRDDAVRMRSCRGQGKTASVGSLGCPHRRAAFTLLEVLVALGLSLILISAIYSAISIHWSYEVAGRERIDRSQLSLALFRLFAEDIGSVAYTPPSSTVEEDEANDATVTLTDSSASTASSSTSSTSSSSSTGATADSGASATSSTVVASSDLGVVGTAEMLQLDISLADREEMINVIPSGQTARASLVGSQRRVIWGMVTPSSAMAASRGSNSSGLKSLTVRPALARQMADRLREIVNGPSNEASELKTELSETSIIAQEVVSLQFRYYDGYAWVSEWDSSTKGRLPRAIEVTLGYVQPEYKRPGSLNLPGSETILLEKHVFLVPASTPVSGDEL